MPTIQQFLQDQYAATSATRCIKVYIPDDDSYVPLLAGLLALAGSPENYQDPESAQAEGVAAIWSDAYRQSDWEGCGTPPECEAMQASIILFGSTADVKTGNAMAFTIDAAQRFNCYFAQNPAANGDKLSWTAWLDAGDWAYRFTYQRTTGSAQVNIRVSDAAGMVENVTVDEFGATQANTIFNGSFTLTVGRETEISMEVTGRNAGNTTNWLNRIIALELWRVN